MSVLGFDSASYFSQNKGYADASAAYNYCKGTLKQPGGSAIYFAVDYDASLSDIQGCITQYFNGIQIFMNGANNYYQIGVYGSYTLCHYIRNGSFNCHYTYRARSTGWSGYAPNNDCTILQGGDATESGIALDYATAVMTNYGGFQI